MITLLQTGERSSFGVQGTGEWLLRDSLPGVKSCHVIRNENPLAGWVLRVPGLTCYHYLCKLFRDPSSGPHGRLNPFGNHHAQEGGRDSGLIKIIEAWRVLQTQAISKRKRV